jgi:TrmH family RNA methyltransferase
MVVIRSAANKTFRELARLHKTRAIIKSGKALVPGRKVIMELLAREPDRCLSLIHEEGSIDDCLYSETIPAIGFSPPLFRKLDRWGCGPPLLLFKVTYYPPWTEKEFAPGCTLVVPFQDPRNLGATLRSAAAFGVRAVILTTEAAHPMHPEAIRAAAGTEGLLDIFTGPSLEEVDLLPKPTFALDLEGTPLSEVGWPPAFGLVAGIEGQGLPSSVPEAVERITIPTVSRVESLNANTALGIALYAWRSSISGLPRSGS